MVRVGRWGLCQVGGCWYSFGKFDLAGGGELAAVFRGVIIIYRLIVSARHCPKCLNLRYFIPVDLNPGRLAREVKLTLVSLCRRLQS